MSLNNWIEDENGNKIHKTALIGDNVTFGKNNTVYPYAIIGMPGFIRNSDQASGKIIIGNNNKIGNHVSIMIGEENNTVIGDNNLIMNYCNIGHDVVVGNDNEIGVKSILAGYSKIGNGNKIKLSCTIRNRKIIGNNNIIGMGSVVTKDFSSDGLIIYGNPAKFKRFK